MNNRLHNWNTLALYEVSILSSFKSHKNSSHNADKETEGHTGKKI